MISLDVPVYCHTCIAFEPSATSVRTLDNDLMTYVRCVNDKKCANLYRHIHKEIDKKEAETYKCD